MPDTHNILGIGEGNLYAMAMPSPDTLHEDIAVLKNNGINSVVCLLETDESERLGLADEQTACSSQALSFTRFAIEDFGVPAKTALALFIDKLYLQILNGDQTVVHCRGGIGRTGLICCCVLIKAGYSPDHAMQLVSEMRGKKVPETADQVEVIKRYSNEALADQVRANKLPHDPLQETKGIRAAGTRIP